MNVFLLQCELLKLNEAHEKWATQRMQMIAQLAQIRNVEYTVLIKNLGITPMSQHE